MIHHEVIDYFIEWRMIKCPENAIWNDRIGMESREHQRGTYTISNKNILSMG